MTVNTFKNVVGEGSVEQKYSFNDDCKLSIIILMLRFKRIYIPCLVLVLLLGILFKLDIISLLLGLFCSTIVLLFIIRFIIPRLIKTRWLKEYGTLDYVADIKFVFTDTSIDYTFLSSTTVVNTTKYYSDIKKIKEYNGMTLLIFKTNSVIPYITRV